MDAPGKLVVLPDVENPFALHALDALLVARRDLRQKLGHPVELLDDSGRDDLLWTSRARPWFRERVRNFTREYRKQAPFRRGFCDEIPDALESPATRWTRLSHSHRPYGPERMSSA